MEVNDSDETSTQVAASIARLAEDAFAQHELKHIGAGEWLCKRPGSGAYHFYVLARPGMLAVWGDLGEWILRMSNEEPARWAADAVRSPGYLFEKVQAACGAGKNAFYPADAKAWVRQQYEGSSDPTDLAKRDEVLADLAQRESEWDVLTREMAVEVLIDHGFDDIRHIGVEPSPRSWWLLEALKWFIAHRVDQVAAPPAKGTAP